MRSGARIGIALGLLGATGAGCASLAGIEDLQLTGSTDASADTSGAMGDATVDSAESGSGSSSGGSDTGADTGEAGSCSSGQVQCAGNAVQSCGANGQWGPGTACTGQTCVSGACTGTCAPGQTNPVPCGHCGTDTQTCSASGAWQTSGACAGEGACAPNATETCNAYGSQTCTPACAWGACSCASPPVCTPGAAQCSGTGVQTCGGCGQWGSPVACPSGACAAGACTGTCTVGQKQCSGNGVQTCTGGQWGAPAACTNQTCVSGACTGSCAPGQTNPVTCGKCGTDTETCSASGAWQSSGTCAGQGVCAPNATQSCNTYGSETCSASCAWGSCSCGATPVCTPGAKQCSGSNVQTCTACGQWGNPASCGAGMTCTGSGTCVVSPTDCPGAYIVCDGFEGSTTINGSTWSYVNPNDAYQTIGIDGTQAHRGANSLHVHFNALGNVGYVASFVRETKTPGSTPIYIRAWVLLSAYTGVDNDALFTLRSDANGASASGALGFDTSGEYVDGVQNTTGNVYDYSRTATGQRLPTGLSAGNWTCIELLVDPSYAAAYPTGQLQVWHGASTTPDALLTGTAELQPLAGIEFGLTFTGPPSGMTNPVDLYFDDIAIDTKYINCSD